MAIRNNFAVFILTHGRPQKIKTIKFLRLAGYTGKIFLVVDDLDKSKDEYIREYGDQVCVFNKMEWVQKTDSGDNFGGTGAVVYARNAVFGIAKELGFSHFIMLDDDYDRFENNFNQSLVFVPKPVHNMDAIFDLLVDFHKKTGIYSIAMAQNGDFIGGMLASFAEKIVLKRKCMNTFVCDSSKPFSFMGRTNEDVNAYVLHGSRGMLFFTTNQLKHHQTMTQQSSGGLTETYLQYGTYVKSFYSIMYHPSSVKISLMGYRTPRLHHKISWVNTVPRIMAESVKK